MTSQRSTSFVAVAGSIATGKTQLVNRLAEALGATALPEEVEGNPYFKRFYEEPSRWAFHSQAAFAADTLARHALASDTHRVVQDRTIYEVVDVFARLLLDLEFLDSDEFNLLAQLRDGVRELPHQPTAMVYLHAQPSLLLERATLRGREAERNLSQGYLQRLQHHYERFIAQWSLCPVISIDTSKHDLRDEVELEALLRELRSLEDN